MEKGKTCCFFGHRKINITDKLKEKIHCEIETLILKHGVTTFLFGSKSQFDDLCYQTVTRLKERYPAIKRIYVRAEFPHIHSDYISHLLTMYEYTYYPDRILKAGKSVYVQRNYEMIDNSQFCIIYCDENYTPSTTKSGTKIALAYAQIKKRIIINCHT